MKGWNHSPLIWFQANLPLNARAVSAHPALTTPPLRAVSDVPHKERATRHLN